MATRKIKDAVDLTTNEVIYFKGHAQATYMADGTTVEDAVNNKVSKVEGKQLSTEDFTTPLKDKLDNLHNYDDSALVFEVEELRRDVDALESGSTEPLATVAKTGDYNDLNNKPTIPAEQVNADWNATSGKAQILNKPTIPVEVTESMVSDWGFTKNVGTVTENELVWIKAEGEAGVRLKGTNGTATGNLAISAGDDKTASDGTAFPSVASGDHAVVFGFGNTCAGRSTLAQGLYNTVNGKDSVAFGQRNLVGGDQAFAAGQQNEVSARLGVAIGYQNKATNTDSIAIGYKNTSSGSASVAMGDTCEANGTSSTAMGYKTKASGAYSATFGENTQATNKGEVAMGLYNKSTTSTDASEQTMFSFGIGTSDTNRMNALEVKKNGDVYIGDKLLTGEGITEADIAAMGFTKNEGTYSKPSDGIPKTDLASDVQASLGKADTALQSYTEQYKGTVTGININGTTNYPNPSGIVYLEDIGGGNTGYPITRERTDLIPQNRVYNLYVEPNTYHILTKTTEIAHEIKINLNSYDPFNTEEYVIELVGFEDIDTITMPSGVNWADVKSPSIIEGATIVMSIVNGKGVWAKF